MSQNGNRSARMTQGRARERGQAARAQPAHPSEQTPLFVSPVLRTIQTTVAHRFASHPPFQITIENDRSVVAVHFPLPPMHVELLPSTRVGRSLGRLSRAWVLVKPGLPTHPPKQLQGSISGGTPDALIPGGGNSPYPPLRGTPDTVPAGQYQLRPALLARPLHTPLLIHASNLRSTKTRMRVGGF